MKECGRNQFAIWPEKISQVLTPISPIGGLRDRGTLRAFLTGSIKISYTSRDLFQSLPAHTFLSIRPGRIRAGSSDSIRLVAMMT